MELPVSKVKRIAKFDPDVKLVSSDGALALTLSCEMFIKQLAERVYEHTRTGKRRTIQIRDFDACLRNTPVFSFLEGALETWTDVAGNPGACTGSSRKTSTKGKTVTASENEVHETSGGTEDTDQEIQTDQEPPPPSTDDGYSEICPDGTKRPRLETDVDKAEENQSG